MEKIIRIGGAQGFYGDSPMGAMAMVMAGAVDFIMQDALAELTLSILQKDKLRDPAMGYAKDIEFNARMWYPMAIAKGIKIVTNAGGQNPIAAAQKVKAILAAQGVEAKIAAITGDDLSADLITIQEKDCSLENMDTGRPFSENKFSVTHANVYIGAQSVKEALDSGADIILAGRVADPSLCVGILAHAFGWNLHAAENLDRIANATMIGHILECGGQASGGNSYAEWPPQYTMSDLGYPIAEVKADGSAIITKLEGQGGKVSRNTVSEQLVYEIHDPANYITPDIIADFTKIEVTEIAPDRVSVGGAKGKAAPENLKLCIGLMEGYITEQFFFFSWPHAYEKAKVFERSCREIWDKLPFEFDRIETDYIGLNGIHREAAPQMSAEWIEQMPEIGVRLSLKHQDKNAGKMAMHAITCLGLNGPPGITANPSWGKDGRAMLSLWATLIPRNLVQEKVEIF